jgi:transposase-like protein
MQCPRCNSEALTRDGTTQLGGQRFRCSCCNRRFTRRSSSAFSGRAFPDDVIALAVRWYVRYRLSYAEVSEWLAERGILVDQSTIYRWVQRFLPLFDEAARKYRQPVGLDWRVDGIERDHGFPKERLRPMRGLKSVTSAAIFMRGHALMRNIRRGFYAVIEALPQRLVFAWTWNRLLELV